MPNVLQDNLKSVSSVADLIQIMGAHDMPILVCKDDQFDETCVDFSDCETVTLTQTDEHGITHTVILSAKIIAQMSPFMVLWKQIQVPPIDPPKLVA